MYKIGFSGAKVKVEKPVRKLAEMLREEWMVVVAWVRMDRVSGRGTNREMNFRVRSNRVSSGEEGKGSWETKGRNL